MKRALTLIVLLLTAMALTVQGTSRAGAQPAQFSITYASSSGLDSNDCRSPATACQSIGGALLKTAEGGTVQCVSSGGFGGFLITRSVTIDCLAGGGGTNASLINIDAAGKTVVLRNIAVNAGSASFPPIDIKNAANVYFENLIVSGSSAGIAAIRDGRAGPGKLVIRNSSIVRNAGVGILVAPASGVIGVELDNVNSSYNTYGVAAGFGGRVMIRNSVFSGNDIGIGASPGSVMSVNSSEISYNSIGVNASLSASVALRNSSINSNSTAISGPTQSPGNNQIFANSANGTTPTIVGSQ